MNKIGIISDSHDNQETLKKAVEILNKEGIDIVLHAGDIIAPFTAKILKNLKCRVYAVYGNNDGERELLRKTFEGMDSAISDFQEIEFRNIKIALYHGTEQRLLQAIIKSGEYDLVATGHTHRRVRERVGRTLVVNPGELCGYLTGEASFAIVDGGEVRFEFIE